MSSKEKDAVRLLHLQEHPPRRSPGVVYVVAKVVKVIAQEDHAIKLLGFKPAVRIFRVMVKVGDDERGHDYEGKSSAVQWRKHQ